MKKARVASATGETVPHIYPATELLEQTQK